MDKPRLGLLFGHAYDEAVEDMPPHVNTDTSRLAANLIKAQVNRLQQKVLNAIGRRGKYGATDHELHVMTLLDLNTIRPRRVELRRKGLIVDSGRRRINPSGRPATVWITKNYEDIP